MEMPELNEDILAEPNSEIMNQAEDSASLDEAVLNTENQISDNMDAPDEKLENEGANIISEQQEDDNLDDIDMPKGETDSFIQQKQEGNEPLGAEEEKQLDEEPAKKKLKLDDSEKILNVDQLEQQHLQPEVEPEPETESHPQSQQDDESETQNEGNEQQEVMDLDKNIQEGIKLGNNKDGEKQSTGPDTDMLATLASAALEQDPKDKNVSGTVTPKSPIVKVESETPKKKQEMWCNVGVFDTNTTIVSDYLATPESSEHVDLVSATLGGRRIQLEPGTAYKFRVCAVNGCGTGPWSDVAAFKTTLPGFPGAPSAIKISKSPEGAHLTWEPPGDKSSEILEYAVYLAVRSASQGCQPVTTNQAQLAFVRVFCGPTNKCTVGTNSLQAAHIDTTTKPAIIFRIAARNSKGYGPATQVRWLQDNQNGTSQAVKRAIKS